MCAPWNLAGMGLSLGCARRALDGAARRAVVHSAWLGVVDESADAVGKRVARVFVELAGL
jgi:hypothetical protein